MILPSWVQSIMALPPLRYYVDVTYGILLKGIGLDLLWDSIMAMVLLVGAKARPLGEQCQG